MEIHFLGEFQEENGYVGHLITDFFLPLLCTGMDLIGGLPNEVLQKFTGFSRNCDCEFFGRVELVPVARLAERSDAEGEIGDRVVHGVVIFARRLGGVEAGMWS